jgi:nucleoside-diphosphate-sugar epimerase/glycosyltransferase involved in cell wall biosynthesis
LTIHEYYFLCSYLDEFILRIAITGGTGFIGRRLIQAHLEKGDDVSVFTRKNSFNNETRLSFIKGDLLDQRSNFSEFLNNVDIVYHCAGELNDEKLMFRIHVESTERLLQATLLESERLGKAVHWVQLSSVGAYGPNLDGANAERSVTEETALRPVGSYETTKTQSDELIIQANAHPLFSFSILRPSNVFGEDMPNNSLRQLGKVVAKGLFFYIGRPNAKATYVHVDDVVEALILCGTDPRARGEVFNISNDCLFEEMVEAMANALDKPPPSIRVPELPVRALVFLMGKIFNLPLSSSRIDAFVSRTQYPHEKLERVLKFSPKISVISSIGKTINEEAQLAGANQKTKTKIAIIAPTEMTVRAFLLNHIINLQDSYEISVITHTSDYSFLNDSGVKVKVISLHIVREISFIRDLLCLLKLMSIIKENRFDLIFSVAPKTGLLTMLAGFFLKTPIRIHMFTGQIWATRKGVGRLFFKLIDSLIAKISTHILADSKSQRKFLENEGVVLPGRLGVLADGSICGINELRFKPDTDSRTKLRSTYMIPDDAVVFLFLGRLRRDKGVLDLASAMNSIHKDGHQQVYLLIVGPDEDGMRAQIEETCASCLDKLYFVDYTNKPEIYMASADVFCLPSYREGFGLVVLEAASCGLPSVASNIYGLTDAVQEGVTGLLHQPKSILEIQTCLMKFVNDKRLCAQMGQAARNRAISLFNEKRVVGEFKSYLDNVIKSVDSRET